MEKNKELGVIHNFITAVPNVTDRLLDQIQCKISEYVDHSFEMKGAFVLTINSDDSMIYSKSMKNFSKIEMIADFLKSIDLIKFYKTVSGPNYKQIDLIKYNSHQIYFARCSENVSIFLVFGNKEESFQNQVQTILENLKNYIQKREDTISQIPTPQMNNETKSIDQSNPLANNIQKSPEMENYSNSETLRSKLSVKDDSVPVPKF